MTHESPGFGRRSLNPGACAGRRAIVIRLLPHYVPVMSFRPNLDAYFARIGFGADVRPSRRNLDALVRAHVQSIPFENIDVLLDRGISLELDAIEDKLVNRRRGGYCFEQNTYFASVLSALGYDVTPISARVLIRRPRSPEPARTHVFLRVQLAGEQLLVDVGVGGLSLTSTLRLELDVEQATPHDVRRIIAEGDWDGLERRSPDAALFHQVAIRDVWHDVCTFTLEPMAEIDRTVANWYTSTHPQSHFRGQLLAARAHRTGRAGLLGRELTLRNNDGSSTAHRARDAAELREWLLEHFGLELSLGEVSALPEG